MASMDVGMRQRTSSIQLILYNRLDGTLDIRMQKGKTVFQQTIGDGALTSQKNVTEFTHCDAD